MPPKKEVKEKQVKGDEAEEMVLQYLKSVNRPYASTDVSANLKNKVPKAAAQKILTTLAEKGSLTCKMYGKQSIFVYNQTQLSVASSDDLAGLDQEYKTLQQLLEDKRRQLKTLQTDLTSKTQMPKTKQLDPEIERVKSENAMTLKAVASFRGDQADGGATVAPLSSEEIKKIDDRFAAWRKQWLDRKKVYKEMLGILQEAGQVDSTPAFEDAQGINVDEDEALEVENGEFCKPPIGNRPRPAPMARPSAKPTTAPGTKRSMSVATTEDSQSSSQPKKKAKK